MRLNPTQLAMCVLILALANSVAQAPRSRSTIAAPPQSTGPAWVSYTDSAEGAFSVDVPVGWQVQGGMSRFGFADVRWMLDVRSLDGKVIIRLNDVNIPAYAVPTANTPPQGQPLILPQQMQLMVSSWRDARAYAEVYAKHRFASVCTTLTPRPADWKPTLPPDWQVEAEAKSSVASLAYNCSTSDGPRLVAIYLRTTLHGVGLWQVDPVVSILATPASMPLAHAMVQRIVDTWQSTSEWQTRQQQITSLPPQQMQKALDDFMQQMRAYTQRRAVIMNQQLSQLQSQHARVPQISAFGLNLVGLTSPTDPVTGTQFKLVSGPVPNFYSNANGVTIRSNVSPGAGFHQVTPPH